MYTGAVTKKSNGADVADPIRMTLSTAMGRECRLISRPSRASWGFIAKGQGEGISGWKAGGWLGVKDGGIPAERSMADQGQKAKSEASLGSGLSGKGAERQAVWGKSSSPPLPPLETSQHGH